MNKPKVIAVITVAAIIALGGFFMHRQYWQPPKVDPLKDPRMVQLRAAQQVEDSNDFQRAAELYRQALQNIGDPKHPWYGQGKLGLGRILVHQNFDEGVKTLREVADETSYYPRTRAFALMTLADVKGGEEHLGLHQEAEKLYPNSIAEGVIAWDLATEYREETNPQKREELYRVIQENLVRLEQNFNDPVAIQSHGTRANVLNRKAGALLYLGDIQNAEAAYREAIRLVQIPPTTAQHHNIEKYIRFFYAYLIAANYPDRITEAREIILPAIQSVELVDSQLFDRFLVRVATKQTHHHQDTIEPLSVITEFADFVKRAKKSQ